MGLGWLFLAYGRDLTHMRSVSNKFHSRFRNHDHYGRQLSRHLVHVAVEILNVERREFSMVNVNVLVGLQFYAERPVFCKSDTKEARQKDVEKQKRIERTGSSL